MRLIDADALVEHIKKWYWDKKLQSAKDDPTVIDAMIDLSIRTVKNAPTIEAEPVRHGIWLKNDLGQTYCSICKRQIPTVPQLYIEYGDFEEDTEIEETEYCPNCGAKMDGGAAKDD